MGSTFFDCRVEKNFTQLEISEEITKKTEKSQILKEKPNLKNKKEIRSKKIKREKKLNNISNTTNNEEDDMIIINTDEEKSDKENTNKNNKMKNPNKKNDNITEKKNKKINNTIYINNSNVTISQLKEKKLKEEINDLKPYSNHFNQGEDNIELDEILSNVFNNNQEGNNINSNSNHKNVFTESDIDYTYNKEYFDQLYSEQSQIKLDLRNLNEDDEKIIKKLNKLKEKINNKNKPKKKSNKYHKYKFEFNPVKAQRTISMNNKQIKKNIPSYRRSQGFFNSISFNKNSYLNKFKGNKNLNRMHNSTLGNSFNKSLYNSLMFDSVKEHLYNNSMNSNNLSNNFIDGGNIYRHSKGTPSIYSIHKSYFNNSSINQSSSNGFSSQVKSQKNKGLYKVITNKTKNKSKQKISSNKIKNFKNNLMNIEIKKEIENNYDENDNNLFFHQYRDIIEIILPNNFYKDSISENKIYAISKSNKNKAILNYKKLNQINTSTILYDGILYKVSDKKNKGFKLSKRYFQIKKNCFRYYTDFFKEKNEEKPLVQFDIRHIKDLQIIENDFLFEYKIENKDIEMVFCIYLNQNEDFFVFAVNNENLGKSVFDILNLLKNYYEDKK